jgi:predicted transcriptional regulator
MYEDFFNLLLEKTSKKEQIEIREMDKHNNKILKRKFYKTIEGFLRYYQPDKNNNCYFGVAARKSINGKTEGKASNYSSTKALWCDYDDSKDINKIKSRIIKVGLPIPTIIIDSGHGLHCYWILKERTNEDIKPLLKAISVKTSGDMKSAEKMRIMRIPFSFNVKSDPILCDILELHKGENYIYELESIQEALKADLKTQDRKTSASNKKSNISDSETVEGKLEIEINREVRPCIRKMLKGVREGQRNFSQMRLVKYFQKEGYNKNETLKLIKMWNKRNNPLLDLNKLKYDFQYHWHEDYKMLGCKFSDAQLQLILNDFCDQKNCYYNRIGELELNNSINFNNRIYNKLYKLDGNEIIIYATLLQNPKGLKTNELVYQLYSKTQSKTCMSKPSRIKALKKLIKLNLIQKTKGNRRKGIKDKYKAIKINSFGLGYTTIANGVIMGAINRIITPAQLKVYILLLKYYYNKKNTKKEVYPSTLTLAKELRITRNCISMHISSLEKARYLVRNYKKDEKGREKLYCKLLM